ncbi:Ornithine cyclodeaminase/mu-crystallin family [Popillia japonica]|uniref:Ornithine cyclodeaminase/mu-crystallin family n=1 Tax=Popillia japonica TaxID=7064 RepID=A0AAW1MGG3_POPJA
MRVIKSSHPWINSNTTRSNGEMSTVGGADIDSNHVAGIEHELQHLVTRGVVFQGEIGSIINGTLPKPISSRTTIFQSLGMAAEDCAVAKMVYEKYLQGFS